MTVAQTTTLFDIFQLVVLWESVPNTKLTVSLAQAAG
jgi:hypothetical protein